MEPSPTGALHIGNARTALYNYLLARKTGGSYILRIADTARDRSRPEFEKTIFEGFRWLGIEWDEGPEIGGDYGPYRQSERIDLHREWLGKLIDLGWIYRCFCTPQELADERRRAQVEKRPPKYSGKCRNLSEAETRRRLDAGEDAAYRFRVQPRTVEYRDLVLGGVREDAGLWGDFVVCRSNCSPLLNFAVVVDDHTMEITDVVRGADHISNTFRQIVVYEALGIPPPRFAHLPLILNRKKQKLSKRDGSVSVEEYLARGYLPEAVRNFIALLGWNPGDEREMFSLEELVREYSLDRVSSANPIYDIGKLDWFNGVYMRGMTVEKLASRARPFVESAGLNIGSGGNGYFERAVGLEQERVKKLTDFGEALAFFFQDEVDPDMKFLVRKKGTADETAHALQKVLAAIREHGVDDSKVSESDLRGLANELGWKAGELFMPIRVAITGSRATPPLFETMQVLGEERVTSRLSRAITLLRGEPSTAS